MVHEVVRLHLNYLETRFNYNVFSIRLFNYYYKSLISIKHNIALISTVDNNVVGYICFIESLNNIYLTLIKEFNILFALNYMAAKLIQPKIIYQDIVDRLSVVRNYFIHSEPVDHDYNITNKAIYELRPIVVAPMYRGSALVRLLIERAEQGLLNKGVRKYFLRVNRLNQRAINFYTKNGLKIVGTMGPDMLRMEKALL